MGFFLICAGCGAKNRNINRNIRQDTKRNEPPRKSFSRGGYEFLCLFSVGIFEGFAHGLTDTADAFLVGVSVHSQGGAAIGVIKADSNADHIGTACDGEACRCVAQFMRVEVVDAVSLAEALEKACGRVRVHRVGTALLREHPAYCDGLGLPQRPLLACT